ncbi:hypothetical protein K1T71_011607 [Dendrolimus kikuchii]|uniref:Uncharacterized protein n=1 Tax=Dendrolimus kikuchii TaxID=765133 RepID=A0ACC1CLQ9_9NEOP|nr:hypothetical protein K1T71_011607 [Dendrolimus kikuchii]
MFLNKTTSLATLIGFHSANSYILLTANMEDVHEIAKQMVESPVVGQLNNIFRRAATMFKQQVENGRKNSDFNGNRDRRFRAEDTDDVQDEKHESNGSEENPKVVRRNQDDEALVALGKNASFYLNSIKKIFDNI